MRKTAQIELPEFEIKPNIEQSILSYMRKNKKATQTIISQKINCSPFAARDNLNKLVAQGILRDLGNFRVNGKRSKVYEIV